MIIKLWRLKEIPLPNISVWAKRLLRKSCVDDASWTCTTTHGAQSRNYELNKKLWTSSASRTSNAILFLQPWWVNRLRQGRLLAEAGETRWISWFQRMCYQRFSQFLALVHVALWTLAPRTISIFINRRTKQLGHFCNIGTRSGTRFRKIGIGRGTHIQRLKQALCTFWNVGDLVLTNYPVLRKGVEVIKDFTTSAQILLTNYMERYWSPTNIYENSILNGKILHGDLIQ